MKKTTLNSRIKLITIIATSFLFILLGVIVFQYVRIGNLKAEARKFEQTKTSYEQYINELNEESKIRESRQYVEKYAREQLGMIQEDETIYIFK